MTMLTEALLEDALITREQLDDAMDKQIGAKKPIHELLLEMGFVKEEDMMRISSKVFKLPVLKLKEEEIDSSLIKMIPYDKAKCYGVFPIRKEGEILLLAMSDPQDVIALEDLAIIAKCRIRSVLSTKKEINKYIEEYYQSDDSLYDLLKNIVSGGKVEVIKKTVQDTSTVDLGVLNVETAPVVRLANLILSDALKNRASDVHIEPQEGFTEVRYRIDGDLKNIMKVPVKIQSALVARIKIMAEMNIAEKRKSQDGRTAVMIDDRKVDMRVSVVPTFYGEKIVIRLLDTKEAHLEPEKIGFREKDIEMFTEEISRPQGIILVTGPTGSGKTSTLYAALNCVKSEKKNIVTIEDPIEYLMPGISQIQVDVAKDVTFASGLRSILRQDPNIILVGEIRDRETADVAFRSSQTGHLVFSTVHANSAVSTITRLVDIGLEPFLIRSSLNLIIAQRLIKLNCPHCKEEYMPSKKDLKRFKMYLDKFAIKTFYRGKGCEECGYTGHIGRSAIFEMMKLNDRIRTLISQSAPEEEVFQEAKKNGMKTLAEAGIEKVRQGLTTLEEVSNVADVVEDEPGVEAFAAQVMPAEPEVTSTPSEVKSKFKILVADDESDIRKVIEKRLEYAGYNVITALNGAEAVALAVKEKPDLILMDVMMPEMDGFEATRVLRSKLETAVIPILMLTAKTDKRSELEGLDSGADDYVTKPFDKDKLLARIKILLRRVK